MSDPFRRTLPLPALVYGATGVLPFAAGLLILLFGRNPEQRQFGVELFVVYSAVILSFLGGIRWGVRLPAPDWRDLGLSVMPSLIAAGCLLLEPARALPLLALAFATVGLFDVLRGTHALWPAWFKRLRLHLTLAVVSLHLALIVALP
ncbi:MAG: DUF3429 domain-containing protein [Xanthomonadales bacterium]|jgi:hypothetical protein|nr:DUF3429 domain-containing protein [Xanthomonadales bacterium]